MDEDDVRRASQRFYQAVNGILGGDAAPMLAIWSRADDTTYCDTRGDAEGRLVAAGDVVAQLEQVLRNLGAVVEAAGGTMRDIVKLNIFVRDRDDYLARLKPLGAVFRGAFGDYYPALALFEVSGFFQRDALIELEGMAVIDADEGGVKWTSS